VCKFSSPGHDDIRSAAVQAERVSETFAGMTTVGAKVNCEIPGRANVDHTVTVSLEYTGKTTVELAYAGRAGGNSIGFADTTAPTAYPTAAPTAAPTWDVPQDCAADSPDSCTVTTLNMVGTYIPGQLIMVRNGHQVSKSTDTNSCPTNWKIWAPTNQADIRTAYESSNHFHEMADPQFIIDVTRPTSGCTVDSQQPCDVNVVMTVDSQPSWRTTDGADWFMRSTPYHEPNGDYTANCYLHIKNADPDNLRFNDGRCTYSSQDYMCQPVQGHFVGYAGY
jgi:hypothetical protein